MKCPACGHLFEKLARKLFLEGFERFWLAYPRRRGKGVAERAWSKLKPNILLQVQIMDALEVQKKDTRWTKDNGVYIPHPGTWLNGKYWLNEIERRNLEAPKFDPEKMAAKQNELEALKERLWKQKEATYDHKEA